MRKTLTILALLSSLAGFNQITTQTVNTTTTTVNNQTVITSTVLTTNTIASFTTIPMNNFFIQIPSQTAYQGIDNSNNCYYLLSSCISCSFGIQHTFTTTTFDSVFVSITASSNLDTNYYQPNTILLANEPILNLTTAWQTYSATITNTNAANTSFALTYSLSMSSIYSTWLKDLNVTTYSTSVISNTLISTSLKAITDPRASVYYSQNSIKTDSDQEFKIEVYDLLGKKVLSETLQNSIEIDLNEGIYILSVFTRSNELIQRKRILIENH